MDAIGFLMEGLAKDSNDVLSAAESFARDVAPGVPVHVESHLGAPVATIVDLSGAHQLTVVGSRGLGGFKGMLLGSVSTGVVAGALSAVVVVRGPRTGAGGDADADAGLGDDAGSHAETDPGSGAADRRRPVLVGVDSSPAGLAALHEAFAAASRRACPLVVLHAWMPPSARADERQLREWHDAAQAQLAEQVDPVAQLFPEVSVEAIAYRDRPAAALLARAQSAQLVVVGTRGRSELKGMLLGSTSRALVQHAPCPVMVVR
jgi:nucleotide-binding universal stress UspA family protein